MRRFIALAGTIFFSASLWAQTAETIDVEALLKTMRESQKIAKNQLKNAKETKSVAVYGCVEKRVRLIDRLLSAAESTANGPYKKAVAAKDQVNTKRYSERIVLAATSLKNLMPQLNPCWCEEAELAKLDQSQDLGQGSVNLSQMCKERTGRETIVTLRVPDYADGSEDVNEIEAILNGEYGFPEIPPASPYR